MSSRKFALGVTTYFVVIAVVYGAVLAGFGFLMVAPLPHIWPWVIGVLGPVWLLMSIGATVVFAKEL